MINLTGWIFNYALAGLSIFIFMFFSSPVFVMAGGAINSAGFNSSDQNSYTDQMIIKYRDNTLVRNAVSGNLRASATISDNLDTLNSSTGMKLTHYRFMSGNGQVVKLPKIMTLEAAEAVAAILRADPSIAYAEPDRRMKPMLVPNDPLYTNQWHYMAPAIFAGGANLPAAWDVTTGSSNIVVAVIDTGIVNHADLSGRTVPGYNFISDATTAGNSVGRSSDPSDLGDWVAAGACGTNSPAEDSSWHGTHVSGTIGASSNNGLGVSGINWVSPILPVRVLGKCGGFVSDIADGMRWAAGLAVSGVPANANPAKVLNLSLGGSGACETTFQNAVNDVIAAGATVVVAAGNSNENVANSSPANCNGVISVAAVGPAGGRTFYSNFGTGVTIAAPGGDSRAGSNKGVLSTLNSGKTSPVAGGDVYDYYQGTSMATPHVAGIVSLMLSLKPSLTSSQITTLLQSSARTFPTNTAASGGDCTTSKCGAGIIDAAAAVTSVQKPILSTSAVTAVTTSSATSGGNVTSQGGSAVIARGVCWSTSGNPTLSGTCTQDGGGLGSYSSSISGLAINNFYHVRAYATNSFGTTYGNEYIFYTALNQFLPQISTSTISGITTSNAFSGGNIASDGGAAVTARGVCWSTTTNPAIIDNCTTDGTGVGSYSSSIIGLAAGNTYHVRAYATNSVGTSYGLDQNFSTATDPPTVLTSVTSLITTATASSGGNVTLGGGYSVTARGVCWNSSANPDISGTCTIDGTGTGQFISTITGLAANTLYHVRAYATNSNNDTSYGTDLTFKTLSAVIAPAVNTAMPASSITSTSAVIGGNVTSDGGAPVTVRGVCWSTSQNPTISDTHNSSGSGTGKFSGTISGLSTNTLYHVRAFATNSANLTNYGRDVTFKTGIRPIKFILFAPK